MRLPRIIIDTNVIIAALRSRKGASAKLLSLIGTGLFEVYISIPLALEYEEVLDRQRTDLGLTQEDVIDLVDALCALSIRRKEIYFRWRPYLPDENDAFILELAVAAQCDCIITYNRKDFVGVEKFGIRAIGPKTLLEEIGVI